MSNHIERAETLEDAVRVVAKVHTLDPRAVIELYPERRYETSRRVFSYQFFDRGGLNVGYYMPDMNSVHCWPAGAGRKYSGWQQKMIEKIDLILEASGE